MQDKVVQCTLYDKSKKTLVWREETSVLLAITLKAGQESNKGKLPMQTTVTTNSS